MLLARALVCVAVVTMHRLLIRTNIHIKTSLQVHMKLNQMAVHLSLALLSKGCSCLCVCVLLCVTIHRLLIWTNAPIRTSLQVHVKWNPMAVISLALLSKGCSLGIIIWFGTQQVLIYIYSFKYSKSTNYFQQCHQMTRLNFFIWC